MSNPLRIFHQLKADLNQIILGQERLIERILIVLLADGHLLVEGAPGLAKTRAIKALGNKIEGKFQRIQFTPDLLPADVTGTEIYRPQEGIFQFQAGPIFHNLVLADEINRAPAKVQSALLEAMGERQVTVGGKTYPLPDLFLVMATQNPIEQEGTYPLPEAQLDRFMFKIKIEYPSKEQEIDIVKSTTGLNIESLNQIITKDNLIKFQNIVRDIPVSENVVQYAVNFVRSTRPKNDDAPDFIKEWLDWGAGPRASSFLILGSKAVAALDGRTTPEIADVQNIAKPILRHRIIANFNAEAENISTDDILEKLIESLPV